MPAAKLLKKSASAAAVPGPGSRDLPSCKDILPGTWPETALPDFARCNPFQGDLRWSNDQVQMIRHDNKFMQQILFLCSVSGLQ